MPDDRRLREVAHWRDTFTMPAYPTREAWETRKTQIQRQVLRAAGLLPALERTPLQPIITGRVERDGYSVENVALEAFRGFYATGNLYRPLGQTGPHPAVLAPHGHSQHGRLTTDDRFSVPARCANLALQGYVAFAPDMVGYNDSRQVDGHRRFDTPDRQLWGISSLGLQLWNNIRALDFLCSLPDVDPDRIACTGESGGASQTFLLTAVDDRVRVVAPVNMLSAHYAGGCVCENAPGLRLDLTNMEIVACAAPRPMLLVSATGDWTLNTPRVEYPAVKSIYDLYEAADLLECVQLDAPHNYNRDSREAVYGFLAGHLGGRGKRAERPAAATFWSGPSEPLREVPITPEPAESRRVFPDGASLPAGAQVGSEAVAGRLRELFRAQRAALTQSEATHLVAEALAVRIPGADDVAIEHRVREERNGRAVERCEVVNKRDGARLPALLIRATGAEPMSHTTLVVDAGGAVERGEGALASGDVPAGTSLYVDVFMTGRFLSPFGQTGRPASETHFIGYNRSDTSWRVQDVLTAAASLCQETGETTPVHVRASGQAAVWAALAAHVAPELVRAEHRAPLTEDEVLRLGVPHLVRAIGA